MGIRTATHARQWAQAIAVYEDLRVRLGNGDAALLNNLALAYAQQGDYREALPLAKRAWLLDRGNPVTTDTLGWLLFKSGAGEDVDTSKQGTINW